MPKSVAKYDWNLLRKEFNMVRSARPGTTLKQYCEDKGLSYTNTSREFAAIEDALDALTRTKLRELAPKAVDKAADLLDSEDENVVSRVWTAIVDRAGHSPQASVINIQANATANQALIIPPMFANADQDKLKDLLGGE